MVRKSGKHGVRSGNTLRASNSRYNRHYQADSCIVRKSANLSRRHACDEADESLLDADGVLYSLNKKGRWGLPKLIKDNIRLEHHDTKVSLSQHHKLNRQSNCIDFCSNKGQVKNVSAKHGYFNDASVKNNGQKGKQKRGRRTGKPQEETGEDGIPDPDPEITYDVFYPSPITSSLCHNPKYIRNAELIVYDDGEVREVGRFRKKKGGRHRVNVTCEVDQSDEEDVDSSDDRQSEDEDTPCVAELSPEVMLVDILEAAERAQQLCTEKPRRKKVKRKREVISENFQEDWIIVAAREDDEAYFTTDEGSVDSDSSVTHQLSPTSKLEPVRIILPCETIQPHILRETYQDRYVEANCEPRKFIIDITDIVSKAMRKSVKFDVFLGTFDFSSCAVFCRDASYDVGQDVYRVHININSSEKVIRIETLFDLMHTRVEDVLQAAATYATFLSIDSFEKIEMAEVARSCQKFMFFRTVPGANKWKAESVALKDLVSEEDGYDVISDDDVKVAAAEAMGSHVIAKNQRPEFCNICFEEINTEILESITASCMLQCGHWFCDDCWKEHIRSRIGSGATNLECPEHKCGTPIDEATILSLVNIKYFNLFQKLRNTNSVEVNSNMKWCPNPKCGRVLKTKNDGEESVTVNCECGEIVCFKCLREAHWPASCKQTTTYKQKLVQSGDDDANVLDREMTVEVRGKNCPKCNRFIEKNGGCPSMICVCNFHFCWACLHSFGSRTHSDCYQKKDRYQTKKKLIKHVENQNKKLVSSLYKMSVQHRALRKPQHVRALKATATSLSCNLGKMLSKGHDVGVKVIGASTVHDFVLEVVQLKLELHHVIEHTAVLLDQRHIGKQSRKLGHVCRRLDYICTQIGIELECKGREELTRAIPTLNNLRQMAKRGITALVSALAYAGAGFVNIFDE